jgi:GTP-binding protein Era
MVAIVGRPNVGKSTLLNRLLEQKISITSRKPQTTRHRILGIRTAGADQVVFVDTPGIHAASSRALNRAMNRQALQALVGIDLILFMIEAGKWTEADEHALASIDAGATPVFLLVNKVDRVADKAVLLPFLEMVAVKGNFAEVVPLSARGGNNLKVLEHLILDRLPTRPHLFPEDQVTDRSERFLVAEIIREKLIRLLGQELPYSTAVLVERFAEEDGLVQIDATIWVDRPGQKPIVVGKGGAMLKKVGEQARKDIQVLLGRKVFLRTWVKVKENWADDAVLLERSGLDSGA